MLNIKKTSFILFLALIISSCFASSSSEITSINITISINEKFQVSETMELNLFNNFSRNSSYFYIFVSDLPEEVSLTDEEGNEINFTSFVANNIFTLRVIDSILPNSSKKYYLSYYNNDLVSDFNNQYLFSYYYTSYYTLDDLNLKIILPKNYGVSLSTINSVSPPNFKFLSNGQEIIVHWKDSVSYLQSSTHLIIFERLKSNIVSILYIIIFALVGVVFGSLMAYFFYNSKKKDIVTMALSSDEKLIIDYIIEKKGKLFQNEICKDLDFSKPKLSKLIHNLKEKNIVQVSSVGRKNLIELNKKVL